MEITKMVGLKFKDIRYLVIATRFVVLDKKRKFLFNEKYVNDKKEKLSKDKLDIINECEVICIDNDFEHINIFVDYIDDNEINGGN
jgi:hypothetical protein